MKRTVTPRLKKHCPDCPPVVTTPSGYTLTRPSCAECVEKHLGAAYVLLTETRDGYAHHLRAIGHLFEAEDESQQWQELHAAIREARATYQQTRAIPDWQKFQDMIDAIQRDNNANRSDEHTDESTA